MSDRNEPPCICPLNFAMSSDDECPAHPDAPDRAREAELRQRAEELQEEIRREEMKAVSEAIKGRPKYRPEDDPALAFYQWRDSMPMAVRIHYQYDAEFHAWVHQAAHAWVEWQKNNTREQPLGTNNE